MQNICLRAMILLGILAGVAVLGVREAALIPDGNVHVAFLDVGQGDSALITTPHGRHILVDGGPDWTTLYELGRRLSFFDRTIDLVVLSHSHLDHLASFPELFRRFRVQRVLMSGIDFDLRQYAHMLWEMRKQGAEVIASDVRKQLDVDGVLIDIYWPPRGVFGVRMQDVNNESVVLRMRCGNQSVLFAGDMEVEEEHALLATDQDLRANVVKVGHHGSRTSSSTGFLLAIGPNLAVISVGRENRYHLPNTEVLWRLKNLGVRTHRTDIDGPLELRWKGPCKRV